MDDVVRMVRRNLRSNITGGVIIRPPIRYQGNAALVWNGNHEILQIIMRDEIRFPSKQCHQRI